MTSPRSNIPLWEQMFKFAWKILQSSDECDSSEAFDTDTESEQSDIENNSSENEEDREYCDNTSK